MNLGLWSDFFEINNCFVRNYLFLWARSTTIKCDGISGPQGEGTYE